MEKRNNLEERILLLIHYLGKVYGRTFLQKFFFLVNQELVKDSRPRYIKYHYGPFSMDVVNDTNNLIASNIIQEKTKKFKQNKGHYYVLTDEGEQRVKTIIKESNSRELKKFKKFCLKYKGHTPSELLKIVYIKYPEWTANSKLVN